MKQVLYTDGTPSREVVDDEVHTFTLIITGKITIGAGACEQVRIELTETQLRSLAYHATAAVNSLDQK